MFKKEGVSMFCIQCGNKMQDVAIFCDKCGTKRQLGDETQPTSTGEISLQTQQQVEVGESGLPNDKSIKKKPSNIKRIFISVAAALVFLFIIGVIFDDPPSDPPDQVVGVGANVEEEPDDDYDYEEISADEEELYVASPIDNLEDGQVVFFDTGHYLADKLPDLIFFMTNGSEAASPSHAEWWFASSSDMASIFFDDLVWDDDDLTGYHELLVLAGWFEIDSDWDFYGDGWRQVRSIWGNEDGNELEVSFGYSYFNGVKTSDVQMFIMYAWYSRYGYDYPHEAAPDIPGPVVLPTGVVWVEFPSATLEYGGEFGGGVWTVLLTGVVRNDTDRAIPMVLFEFALYDAGGVQIGRPIASISGLQPGRSGRFSHPYFTFTQPDQWQILNVTAVRLPW